MYVKNLMIALIFCLIINFSLGYYKVKYYQRINDNKELVALYSNNFFDKGFLESDNWKNNVYISSKAMDYNDLLGKKNTIIYYLNSPFGKFERKGPGGEEFVFDINNEQFHKKINSTNADIFPEEFHLTPNIGVKMAKSIPDNYPTNPTVDNGTSIYENFSFIEKMEQKVKNICYIKDTTDKKEIFVCKKI